MNPPLLLQATAAHIPQCAEVYAAAFAHPPYDETWELADAAELLSVLLHKDPETCFCLQHEDTVIGLAFCSTLGRFRAAVEEFAIHPAYQRRGWGRLLLGHCISVFQQRGFPAVELIANREASAYGFYTRLGFRPARRNALMLLDL